MEYTLTKNEQFNSIEVLFDGKPCEAIRDALKALRFRWHKVRGVWYGYVDEQTARKAIDSATDSVGVTKDQSGKQQNRPRAKKLAPVLASLWDRCDVSALPGYGTDNEIKMTVRDEARASGASYDKTVAAYIRKHLRERFPECKFSVTSGGAGYLNAVRIDIKSSPFSRELVKGDPASDFDRLRWDHWENAPELDAILKYCEKLLDVFDDDDGDIYADYGARHDLYGSAQIDDDYTQAEPSAELAESAADFAQRKAEHEAAEEARRAAEWAEREKQMEQERVEAERLEAIRTAQAEEITEHVTVTDLDVAEQIAVVGLLEACGKEETLDEVRESIAERRAEGRENRVDAVITRKVNFTDPRIFENFCTMFLHDFDFLAGKGGTATEDVRVTVDNAEKLNTEQRDSVKFYLCDCIGIYLDGAFQFVIDPQGYSYARYILTPDDATDSYKATEKLTEWREQSEQLPELYIPAPVTEQIEGAKLCACEQITLIALDPCTMTVGAVCGVLNSTSRKQYAQHTDAVEIVYTPRGKRKPEKAYLYKAKETLLYRGELPNIPENLKYTDLGENLQRVNFAGEGAKEFMRLVLKYYSSLGFAPAVDTIQR